MINPLEGAVDGSYMGRSTSGWMNSELFFGWLSRHFVQCIPPARPVVLLLDGHSSHINLQTAKFAKENGILLYCLPPHCTHALQPCDVGLFKPLKSAWNKAVRQYTCVTNGKVVTKYTFSKIFKEAWDEALKPSTISNSFKGSGICPLNKNAIFEGKLLPSKLYDTQEAPHTSSDDPFAECDMVSHTITTKHHTRAE